MLVFNAFIAVILIASVDCGIIRNLIFGQETTTMTPKLSNVRQEPLHHNQQNYLDDSENKKDGENQRKKTKIVTAPMTAIGNGVFEFKLNDKMCKFYESSRQAQRSLECNNRRCNSKENKHWDCLGVICDISDNTRTATCELDQDKRNFIRAPPRCPANSSWANGQCRPEFK